MVKAKIRKRKGAALTAPTTSPQKSNPTPSNEQERQLLKEARKACDEFILRHQLNNVYGWEPDVAARARNLHKEFFGSYPPPNAPKVLVKHRVVMEVYHREYAERGVLHLLPKSHAERRKKLARWLPDTEISAVLVESELNKEREIPFAKVDRKGENVGVGKTPDSGKSPEGRKNMAKKKVSASKAIAAESGGRPVGKTTGLGIQDAWVHVFEQNSKAKKADRMTDDQISAWMHNEFPGRESKVFDRVQSVRTKYNKGGLTRGVVPSIQSVPYDAEGNVSEPRRGRPVPKPSTALKATAEKKAASKGAPEIKARKKARVKA